MIARILIILALLTGGAFAQGPILPGPGLPVAAVVPLTMEESAHSNVWGPTMTVTLSTTKTNNLIILDVQTNSAIITGVSGSTLGAFNVRYNSGSPGISRFWAVASSALTSEIITITNNTGPTFQVATAYAIHGANLVTPFDAVSSVVDQTGVADPASINTTAANTMIIGEFRMGSQSNPTSGACCTAVQLNGDFFLTEYQIVSSSQTGFAVNIGTGVGDSNGSIVDAIVRGP